MGSTTTPSAPANVSGEFAQPAENGGPSMAPGLPNSDAGNGEEKTPLAMQLDAKNPLTYVIALAVTVWPLLSPMVSGGLSEDKVRTIVREEIERHSQHPHPGAMRRDEVQRELTILSEKLDQIESVHQKVDMINTELIQIKLDLARGDRLDRER